MLKAYRDLPSRHQFSYLTRRRLMQTVASQNSSTVTYDSTGGTYERMLTIAAGTWPSWAAYGRVVIDGVHYDVDERKSSTQLTLSEVSNPGADVASGTAYVIYRSSYPLPVNFKEFVKNGLWERSQEFPINLYEPAVQNQALQTLLSDPSTPEHATIRATGKYLGGRELVFGPPPNDVYTFDMLYESRPRPMLIDEYSQATVSNTGVTVTAATGATFPLNCVGSVFRFSANTTKPSPLVGGINAGDNPFAEQAIILSRTSATVLVLSEAPSVNYSGVGYTISDPLDVDASVMLSALLMMAEAEFARLSGRNDYASKLGMARQAILEAIEADRSSIGNGGQLGYDQFIRTNVSE